MKTSGLNFSTSFGIYICANFTLTYMCLIRKMLSRNYVHRYYNTDITTYIHKYSEINISNSENHIAIEPNIRTPHCFM